MLTHEAVTFRDVEDTVSKQVVGKEVVYVPLEVDPGLPAFSDFINTRHDGSPRAYRTMTAHAMDMLRCQRDTDLFDYFYDGRDVGRFDQKILNLSIDSLGNIW